MSQGVKQTVTDLRMYKAYKATKPKNLVAPITYGNATTKGFYSGSVMASPRADADAHMSYLSRDSGAQIVRCV